MPKLTDLEVAAIIEQLRLLTESANKYIGDGSWIEALTDDIKNAKRMLKVYSKRLQAQEAKQREIETLNLWNT